MACNGFLRDTTSRAEAAVAAAKTAWLPSGFRLSTALELQLTKQDKEGAGDSELRSLLEEIPEERRPVARARMQD